uniref:CSC1/OSCA1-like 7TM region domain-containing protein n=1 Tax=Alexandrium andersonii TaxID=327968 RepID=A0A7S2NDN8_9DINO
MTQNAAGDLSAFVASFATNIAFALFCFAMFSIFRLRYPIMYSNNALEGIAPDSPPETMWGWLGPVHRLQIDQIASCITLDHAMLLEYTHFSMKILAIIGVPMFFVMGPVNYFFGGHAAGNDRLSYLSFGNIEMRSPLFWVHAFSVWYVVLVVTAMTHRAMRQFLEKRIVWLRQLSELRSNTVLVESIPDDFRQEEKLKSFIEKVLPKVAIKSVDVVKDTSGLLSLVEGRDYAKAKLKEAEARYAKDPSTVPTVRDGLVGEHVEAIPYWKKQIDEFEPKVQTERRRITSESKSTGGVNLSRAFVQFEDRSSAEIMLRLNCALGDDVEQWEMFQAPQATDILWADLTQDDTAKEVRMAIGYALVVLLYFVYMPLVVGITNVAKWLDFSQIGLGMVQPFWQGFAPTLGLQFMVAFLPTFLILIFKSFFTCRAEAWQQHKLQIWYFWFQVVFVLLATAVGQNVRGFTQTIVNDPMQIFSELAATMPYATHFYMNFLVLQWMSHGMVFTRYIPLFKFKVAMGLYDEKDSKAFAEPEDQDYYGMGSRSARWSIAMAISIVFGTLCPPINVLGFLTMYLCRIVYGYLFVYAETRKSDTGGAFFVTQMQHMFVTAILYCILMLGVLFARADSYGPGIIAAPALVWTVGSLYKFNGYRWEQMPIQELVLVGDTSKKREGLGKYVQPEMLES